MDFLERHPYKLVDDWHCEVKYFQSLKNCYKAAEKTSLGDIYWYVPDGRAGLSGEWRHHAHIDNHEIIFDFRRHDSEDFLPFS